MNIRPFVVCRPRPATASHDRNGAVEFTYDDLGNRRTKESLGVTYTPHPTTNQLQSATSATASAPETGTFEYWPTGNLRKYENVPAGIREEFTYSPRDTLTSATATTPTSSTTTSYTYDADGLRIQKSSATGQQYYVRGLGGQLLAEYAALFSKTAPTSGTSGTSTTVELRWAPVIGASAYAYCVHTVNNNCSGVPWTSNGSATTRTLTNLAPGTYYWQAFALVGGQWKEADNGMWWSFSVTTSLFGKQGPPSGQSGLGSDVMLQWGAVPDSGYWVCWDTTNNNSCDSMWWPNGGGTTRLLQGLTPATYYWQVRADTPWGEAFADGNIWWSFTVGTGSYNVAASAPRGRGHGVVGPQQRLWHERGQQRQPPRRLVGKRRRLERRDRWPVARLAPSDICQRTDHCRG